MNEPKEAIISQVANGYVVRYSNGTTEVFVNGKLDIGLNGIGQFMEPANYGQIKQPATLVAIEQ